MVRTPYASYTLVDALDRLVHSLQLLTTGVPEQLRLLEDLEGLHIPNADSLLAAVDILANDNGVFSWSGGDGDLDLGMRGRELR